MHVLDELRYYPVCGSKYFVEQNEKSKRCESYGFGYFLNLSSAVATFTLNEQGELFVIRRRFEPGYGTLDPPDGFCDIGETIGETLIRKVRKETNLTVKERHYFYSLPNKYRYSDFGVPTLDVLFVHRVEDETVLKAADGIEKAVWLPLLGVHIEQFGLRSIRQALHDFLQMESKNLKK